MASEKKYYWLKLQNDFFKRHDIQIVEGMPNGKDYILFYLKLLVESLKHYGHLRFNDTIPYTDEMLAVITNTNIDIVRSAIKIFEQLNMIQILDDNTIFMTEIDKFVGSETLWAEKKRQYRLKQKQKEDNVPKLSEQKKTMSDKSIDIDIDIDKDIDKGIILSDAKNASDQKPIITLTLNDKTEYPIYQEQVDNWSELYPAVNVMQELRNMKGWLEANPKRRKTRTGILKFVNNWLSKTQNQGGTKGYCGYKGNGNESISSKSEDKYNINAGGHIF